MTFHAATNIRSEVWICCGTPVAPLRCEQRFQADLDNDQNASFSKTARQDVTFFLSRNVNSSMIKRIENR